MARSIVIYYMPVYKKFSTAWIGRRLKGLSSWLVVYRRKSR